MAIKTIIVFGLIKAPKTAMSGIKNAFDMSDNLVEYINKRTDGANIP